MFASKRYNYRSFTRDLLTKAHHPGKGAGPKPGERAPDFELESLDGENIRLSDFRGEKNVVLTFGSATCPMTAGSMRGMNSLHNDYGGEDVQFLFVYVREAHPGEELPAHSSVDDKMDAAKALRDEESVEMMILIDELDGAVHRKYGEMPNSTYVIDKSGRVAFRALWTRPSVVEEALDELLQRQEEGDEEEIVVRGGEDRSMPMRYGLLHSHRALERGGKTSVREFREAMGAPGRLATATSRAAEPVVLHPIRALAGAAIAGVVIVAGVMAGLKLRQRRLQMRSPYYFPRPHRRREESGGYEAVGI
jgi:hypothetical protein